MKNYILLFSIFIISNFSFAQIVYESPLGFSLNFDNTWKRLPKEVLQQIMKDIKNLLEYRSDVHFEACYQKIGNADMDYPYILLKNIYGTTTDEDEIKKVQEYYTNQSEIDKAIQNVTNGKFGFELKIGQNYYDKVNKILIITYDAGISIKGNLVGIFAYYFGKNATLATYCYSYKDEFKYDQKEFLDIIYSIKDKGMKTSLNEYLKNHDVAIKYFNDGKIQSDGGNKQEAIKLYSKAIENYPIEDNYMISEAYYNRALNKRYLNNYKEAINDYTLAIKLRPDYYKAYNNRGYVKLLMEDYSGAITDFTMTIKYDNSNTDFSNMAFGNRGIAKISLGQDGCSDLKKAIELGNKNVIKIFSEYCK